MMGSSVHDRSNDFNFFFSSQGLFAISSAVFGEPGAFIFVIQLRGAMYQVILADDQELYREGVAELVSSNDEFQVVAQFSDWTTLLAGVASNPESLLVVATSLVPELDRLVAGVREARSRMLLVASDFDSPNWYHSSEVAGIVQRSTTAFVFMQILRRIQRGLGFNRPSGRTVEGDPVGAQAVDRLTQSEMKCVALLMEGFKNRRIAERLDIPESAVRSRFQKIFDKTGLSTRLELALFISHHRAFAAAAADAYVRIKGGQFEVISTTGRNLGSRWQISMLNGMQTGDNDLT
jgi:DNA-binding NarL/FixJ family response regulator